MRRTACRALAGRPAVAASAPRRSTASSESARARSTMLARPLAHHALELAAELRHLEAVELAGAVHVHLHDLHGGDEHAGAREEVDQVARQRVAVPEALRLQDHHARLHAGRLAALHGVQHESAVAVGMAAEELQVRLVHRGGGAGEGAGLEEGVVVDGQRHVAQLAVLGQQAAALLVAGVVVEGVGVLQQEVAEGAAHVVAAHAGPHVADGVRRSPSAALTPAEDQQRQAVGDAAQVRLAEVLDDVLDDHPLVAQRHVALARVVDGVAVFLDEAAARARGVHAGGHQLHVGPQQAGQDAAGAALVQAVGRDECVGEFFGSGGGGFLGHGGRSLDVGGRRWRTFLPALHYSRRPAVPSSYRQRAGIVLVSPRRRPRPSGCCRFLYGSG